MTFIYRTLLGLHIVAAVSVSDDGPGFAAAVSGEGHGLRLLRSRLATLFGDEGTRIESRPVEMPELNGFELLDRLDPLPLVVFTTAFDQYAVAAFDTNSVDYLVKPIELARLERALDRLASKVGEVDGAVLVRLRDEQKAELPVARDRVRDLKDRLRLA